MTEKIGCWDFSGLWESGEYKDCYQEIIGKPYGSSGLFGLYILYLRKPNLFNFIANESTIYH